MQTGVAAPLIAGSLALLGTVISLFATAPHRAVRAREKLDRRTAVLDLIAKQAELCHRIQIDFRRARRRAIELARSIYDGVPEPEGDDPLKVFLLTDRYVFQLDPGFDLVRTTLHEGEAIFETFARSYRREAPQRKGRRSLRILDDLLVRIAEIEQRLEDDKRESIRLILVDLEREQARSALSRLRPRRRVLSQRSV